MMTKQRCLIGASVILAAVHPATAFQPSPLSSRSQTQISRQNRCADECKTNQLTLIAYSYDDDDGSGFEIRGDNTNGSGPRPETTFGAENVPVEQRPSNEYLNLIQQPTFGWASQESGDAGLVLRLAAVYIGFFFFV